jgi:DNA-binding MarR family transcriptional regulator
MNPEVNRLDSIEQDLERNKDLRHFLNNWEWRTILCLIESPSFHPSPKWTAERINIPIASVVEAFDGLERLKLIHRADNTFKVAQTWLQFTPDKTKNDTLLEAHSNLAPQILSKLGTKDKFTVQFFRGDKKLIEKYAPKFIQLYKEMNDEGQFINCNDVIASEISFVVLTETEKDV